MNYESLCVYIEKMSDIRTSAKYHWLAAKKVAKGIMSKEQASYLFSDMPETSFDINKAWKRFTALCRKVEALEKRAIKMHQQIFYGEYERG